MKKLKRYLNPESACSLISRINKIITMLIKLITIVKMTMVILTKVYEWLL